LAKFHPDVVKAKELEIKYCWADLPLFRSEDSKGHSRKEIRRFLLESIVIDCWSELFHLIVQKNYPHIKTWTRSKFRNESGRIYALKKLPQDKAKDGDENALTYFKKKVPLWNYLEGLESKLTVACTEFKPILIPEPLHIQRAKNCFNTFAGFNYKYDPNFKVDESKFNLILHDIHTRSGVMINKIYLIMLQNGWRILFRGHTKQVLPFLFICANKELEKVCLPNGLPRTL